MNNKIWKILFCGIEEKIKDELKQHLADSPFYSEFCSSTETGEIIKKFNPDILIMAITSFPDYEKQI